MLLHFQVNGRHIYYPNSNIPFNISKGDISNLTNATITTAPQNLVQTDIGLMQNSPLEIKILAVDLNKLNVYGCTTIEREHNTPKLFELSLTKFNMSLGGKGSKILEPLGDTSVNEKIGELSRASHETVRKVEQIMT